MQVEVIAMESTVAMAREFERESHRIDQLIWDAMAVRSGESILFCGFSNNVQWIKRAASVGATVSVICTDDAVMREMRELPVKVVRGSTSMVPAHDESFDATIAFHYLHEVDPLFHANFVGELARVGRRCVIVEPAPPSDPLGLRIASLYSRAKREFGQFETYHHLDYWRKLLALAKADVRCQTFSFMRLPPAEAVRDTIALIIDTMVAEETPEPYIAELRALAARPDAHLVPQARFVIVGASAAQATRTGAGTEFRDPTDEGARTAVAAKPFVPPSVTRAATVGAGVGAPVTGTVYTPVEIQPEFPAVIAPSSPPPAAQASPQPTSHVSPASQIARNAFGIAAPTPQTPVDDLSDEADDTFAVTTLPGGAEPPGDFGWTWEPPDDTQLP